MLKETSACLRLTEEASTSAWKVAVVASPRPKPVMDCMGEVYAILGRGSRFFFREMGGWFFWTESTEF